MSTSQYNRVAFDFAGRDLVGTVADYLAAGDVSGPDGLLVVDVDGARYRVAESDAEPLR
ncbi:MULTISPECIES: hypothetical protein [Haloferacaceae]|uniref:Uncharacterized protein n=1 Tax=Halorubrum glutamatedens TaxID=2707018 RepID=A0ABD5QU01_9EURY|nr:hypothetical protein [Halobellus captivus]